MGEESRCAYFGHPDLPTSFPRFGSCPLLSVDSQGMTSLVFDSNATDTGSTTWSSQSSDESTSKKKTKATYYVRKSAALELKAEVFALQRQVDTLRANQRAEQCKFVDAILTKAQLRHQVELNTNAIASIQGCLFAYQASDAAFPLESFIHLTINAHHRRRTLVAAREEKLRAGVEYMLELVRPLDLRRPHRKLESSFTPQGDLTLSQFDVTVFPDVESVHQVYSALIHYTQEQEISISEALGVISIRESEHCEKEPVLQCRLLTTLSNGLEVESNGAIFFGYFDFQDSPYGIFVSESIAQDDLYPYQRDNRSLLRSTSIILITKTPGMSSIPGTLDVTMSRATFSCLHNPRGIVSSPSVDEITQEFLTRYGCVMLDVLRERLGHPARA